MKTVRINEDLIEIDGKVRVERGPARKREKATEELLSDAVTATHYHAPREETDTATGEKRAIVARDALGKPIQLGRSMDYIDWLGERGWYVYRLEIVDVEQPDGGTAPVEKWVEKGFHDEEAAALAAAGALAGA